MALLLFRGWVLVFIITPNVVEAFLQMRFTMTNTADAYEGLTYSRDLKAVLRILEAPVAVLVFLRYHWLARSKHRLEYTAYESNIRVYFGILTAICAIGALYDMIVVSAGTSRHLTVVTAIEYVKWAMVAIVVIFVKVKSDAFACFSKGLYDMAKITIFQETNTNIFIGGEIVESQRGELIGTKDEREAQLRIATLAKMKERFLPKDDSEVAVESESPSGAAETHADEVGEDHLNTNQGLYQSNATSTFPGGQRN